MLMCGCPTKTKKETAVESPEPPKVEEPAEEQPAEEATPAEPGEG